MKCQHEKVYQPALLLSNPPQQRWICKKCGEKGTDTIGDMSDNEYDRLVEKWGKK